ncbi:cell envelope integrity protein CreD [Alkalimarinus coralli]|uniref:cell envelope integrity protein CreD n=1 Tax=Alkalimarinus coralli TaxID=2935863 RepID=UPI00202B8538|nr:cell envelope integrity protein CreD [Alkalimarinus coralli]
MQKQLAIKIAIIFVIGLLVLIPTTMVQIKIYERQGYLEEARAAVARSWTGAQSLVTPILVVPYQLASGSKSGFYTEESIKASEKQALLLPDRMENKVDVANKSVFKGIYEVPVYNSDIRLKGLFSAEKINKFLNRIKNTPRFEGFGVPYLSIHVSDVRGISGAPSLTIDDEQTLLTPGTKLSALVGGLHGELESLIDNVQDINLSLELSLRGMGGLSFIQLADDSRTEMKSDWPHPEFTGTALPVDRNISSSGFTARWLTSQYSSNAADLLTRCIESLNCHELQASGSGVNFIEPVDVYLQSERSVKYAMLFIGLSFITFFIFEHIKKIRIHPIQYAFVGLAIAVFYLLLISLAEHIAFHWAYGIAVTCCSGLILFYAKVMLKSFKSALLFSLMIVVLYGLLYVIVQAEDFALLMGSILVFLVLTVLMTVTRKIDWYNLEAIEGVTLGRK